MQFAKGGIAGDDQIRVISEPLHTAIPNITMNVVIWARRHPEELNMAQSCKRKPDENNMPRESWRGEEFTNGDQVGNARNEQRNKERRTANPPEIKGTDEQRHEQNCAETVNPLGWG